MQQGIIKNKSVPSKMTSMKPDENMPEVKIPMTFFVFIFQFTNTSIKSNWRKNMRLLTE